MPSDGNKQEIYLEIIDAGPAFKVSAVCPITLEEISFTAPKTTPRAHIERLALQKLRYVLSRKQSR